MNSALKNSFPLISAALKQSSRGFLFILIFLTPIGCSANILINEIAWMGTPISSNDEWIELYNDSNQSSNLSGWKIMTKDGKMTINLDGKIDGNSFYLLERTNDNSVPNISADKIYTGSLANTGETLELYDNSGKMVNSVDCSSGWFAGDNTTKKTMERTDLGNGFSNWATSVEIGGTPRSKNSVSDSQKSIELPETKTDSPILQQKSVEAGSRKITEPQTIYLKGIIINEILPSPEGSDEQNEWIELYNQNSEKVDLSGWKLKDGQGKTTTFVFPDKTLIDPLGFLIFSRNTTKIILNNDNDDISLINPDGKVADTVSYSKAPIDQSYSKINNEWIWNKNLTPGSQNILPSPAPTKSNSAKTVVHGLELKNRLASISPQLPKKLSDNHVLIILIATGLAITFGIIILFIKKKLTK